MEHYLPFLQWLDHQRKMMKELVMKWGNINTHVANIQGLQIQMQEMKKSFAVLGGEMKELNLPPHTNVDESGNKVPMQFGKALQITKRPDAPIKILLAGHMDTVFTQMSAFQRVVDVDDKQLVGPGVCDMKGGLVVLLYALQALEKSPYAQNIGWEVLITPDEEIGSPGSHGIYERAAQRNNLGLLFEPSFADGAIVTSRAGSMKLIVITKGKAAHAGRDYAKGRSAIYAIAPLLVALEELSTIKQGPEVSDANFEDQVIVNVGELRSGAGYNVVPDLAIMRINVRACRKELFAKVKAKIHELVENFGKKEGINMELIEDLTSPPKVIDQGTEKLFDWIKTCASDLGSTVYGRPSRGASDGNYLAAYGLPCIDTLGVIGDNIHTHNELMQIDSLTQRAKLSALLLMRLGSGEYVLKENKVITL